MDLKEDKFETIFNLSKDGIAILDLESNFLEFNPAYLKMSEFSYEELLSKSCIELFVPEDVSRAKEAISRVIELGYVENFEKTCISKTGKRVKISMGLALLPDLKRILISTKDITLLSERLDDVEKLSRYDFFN